MIELRCQELYSACRICLSSAENPLPVYPTLITVKFDSFSYIAVAYAPFAVACHICVAAASSSSSQKLVARSIAVLSRGGLASRFGSRTDISTARS